MSPKDLERYLLNKPQFLFGTNILWYAAIFLFLYVTLGVLRGKPFWPSLAGKKLKSNLTAGKANPWAYFFAGCGLAIFVFIVSSQYTPTTRCPLKRSSRIAALPCCSWPWLSSSPARRGNRLPRLSLSAVREILRHRSRHFAYRSPLRSYARLATRLDLGHRRPAHSGRYHLHLCRAHTGTVVASFLLHLGYNSMIAVATIVGTHGFTKSPAVNQIRFPSPPPLQCLLWSAAVLPSLSRSSRATSCYIQSAHT